jgi:hypothetical protein
MRQNSAIVDELLTEYQNYPIGQYETILVLYNYANGINDARIYAGTVGLTVIEPESFNSLPQITKIESFSENHYINITA